MAATDWVIDGTLLDVTGQPLDLSNPELTWTLIGLEGLPVLANGDATITIVGDPSAGLIRIDVSNTKTALLECGRYIDALQLTIGDIVSPLWLGQILVAANPRRVTSPLSAGSGTARADDERDLVLWAVATYPSLSVAQAIEQQAGCSWRARRNCALLRRSPGCASRCGSSASSCTRNAGLFIDGVNAYAGCVSSGSGTVWGTDLPSGTLRRSRWCRIGPAEVCLPSCLHWRSRSRRTRPPAPHWCPSRARRPPISQVASWSLSH